MDTKIDDIIIKQEKNIKNCYLILQNVNINKESFEHRIIDEQHIDGILEYSLGREDGKQILKFDVSGALSLEDYLRLNKLKKKDMKYIIEKIKDLLITLDNYLISENSILLDPRCIFIYKNNKMDMKFCVVPSLLSDFSQELSRLLVRLLRHVDTTDKKSLDFAFKLFIKSSKRNYSITDLMGVIYDDDKVDTYDINDEKDIEINQEETEEINLYENKEEKPMKIVENDFTKFVDDDVYIDNDTRKALGMNIIEDVDKLSNDMKHEGEKKNVRKKDKNIMAFSLNAKFRLSSIIFPLAAIIVPVIAFSIKGREFFVENLFIVVMYEIMIIIVMFLNNMLDNLYNQR